MAEIEVKVAEIEQRCKSNTYRLDKLEERQDNLDKLVASVAVMAQEQEHIKEDITEIKGDVKALADKPAKRWDNLVEKVIWSVASAALGALLLWMGVQL